MKRIIPFTLFFLLLLLLGCNKDDDLAIVQGTVTEFGTNKPIEGTRVVLLLGSGATSLGGGANVSRRDTFITQADGSYMFNYSKEFSFVDLVADHDDYFFNSLPQGVVCCDLQYDIVMDPHAWIKIHVKNTMPINSNDNIRYDGPWSGGSPQSNFGIDVDFYDLKQIRGNRDATIYWWGIKNNVNTPLNDVIYCPTHDTTLFEIFY